MNKGKWDYGPTCNWGELPIVNQCVWMKPANNEDSKPNWFFPPRRRCILGDFFSKTRGCFPQTNHQIIKYLWWPVFVFEHWALLKLERSGRTPRRRARRGARSSLGTCSSCSSGWMRVFDVNPSCWEYPRVSSNMAEKSATNGYLNGKIIINHLCYKWEQSFPPMIKYSQEGTPIHEWIQYQSRVSIGGCDWIWDGSILPWTLPFLEGYLRRWSTPKISWFGPRGPLELVISLLLTRSPLPWIQLLGAIIHKCRSPPLPPRFPKAACTVGTAQNGVSLNPKLVAPHSSSIPNRMSSVLSYTVISPRWMQIQYHFSMDLPIRISFFGGIVHLLRSQTHQHGEGFPPEELISIGMAVSVGLEGIVLWRPSVPWSSCMENKGVRSSHHDGESFWWLY